MLPFDSLFAPVRDDAPAGEDPSATGVLFELETLVQGKPETQFSAAEEPDWKALKARALEVAATTKDLRVAAILAAALLRTDGLKGFAAGVKLIRGYLEKFWPAVFPLLDATENDDPAERVNALANLAVPPGTDGDLLRVIPALRKTPLVVSARVGRFGLEHYLAVKGTVPWPEGAGSAPTAELLEAVRRDAPPEGVAAIVTAATELLADLEAIEAWFKQQSGPSNFPQLAPLRRELKNIPAWLAVEAAAGTAESAGAEPGAAAAAGPAGAGGEGPSFGGAVRSRDDVMRALDAIIGYYRSHEPASPVPLIITRVKRLVPMSFMQLIEELTPDARDRILLITGPVDGGTSTSSGS